jgi:hypothetical protein
VNRAARAEKGASHQIQENQVEFLPGLPNFGGWHLFLAGLAAAAAMLATAPAGAWDSPAATVEDLSTISTAFETPHTPWARPNVAGRLRVLWFVASTQEGMQTSAREVAELRQRLDMEVDVVLEHNFYQPQFFGGLAAVQRLSRLLDKPYDLFIFQDMTPVKVPTWLDELHTRFAKQVRDGAGVVIIGADVNKPGKDAADPLADREAAEADAFLAGVPVEKVSRFGSGRIVQLAPRPFIPYDRDWEVAYDRWQERLVRTALWAAAREPQGRLEIAAPETVDRPALPVKVAIRWEAAPAGSGWTARLRRRDGAVVDLGAGDCGGSAGSTTLTIPTVRADAYAVEVFVHGLQPASAAAPPVVTWGVHDLVVTAAGPPIEAIDITSGRRLPFAHVEGKDKQAQEMIETALGVFNPAFEIGEMITGTVRTAAADANVEVRLREAKSGRTLAMSQGREFRFPVEGWLPMLSFVEAVVSDAAGEAAAAYAYVSRTDRKRGRFNFVLWGFPRGETLAPVAARSLSRMGVTVVYERPFDKTAAAFGMGWLPFTGGQVESKRAAEWNKPEFADYWLKHLGRASAQGALAYSLGDEGAYSGYAADPLTTKSFHAWLAARYGDVAALNRSWETSFSDFAAVDVLDAKALKALPPPKPTKLPNVARAADLQAFAAYNFTQMAKIHVERMRQERDPEAVIGFEGSGDFYRGADPELFTRELGMWVPYAGLGDELIRSFAPREFIRSTWMGYHHTMEGHCGRFYHAVCGGADSIWYWMWSTLPFQGFQRPDLTGGPEEVERFLADTKFVREGLGDLLLEYAMQDDGIAVFYNQAGNLVSTASPELESLLGLRWTLNTWDTVIRDLGLQYRHVSDAMVARGELESRRTKLLVLPVAHAISPQAADHIRRFVEAGGTVLADFRPGCYDGFGRPHDGDSGASPLDAIFGVSAALPGITPATVPTTISGTIGATPLTPFAQPVRSATGVATAGGTPLGKAGDTPIVIVNTVGKGRAILLNFALWSIVQARQETPNLSGQAGMEVTPQPTGRLIQEIFKAAGVEPLYAITPYKNPGKQAFLGNLAVQRWRDGGYEIVSLFRENGSAGGDGRWAQVDCRESAAAPEQRHLYDIRHRQPVGRMHPGWFWIHDILPGRAGFYVVMPHACPPPRLELPKSAAQGTVVKGKLSVPGASGRHAIRITGTLPDGTTAEWVAQTVIVGKDPVEVAIPVAHDDPAGSWSLMLTDSFTDDTRQTVPLRVE